MDKFEFIERTPPIGDFLALRHKAGLSPRSVEAAERGLPHSLYAISVIRKGRFIGMGRVVGDGGCNFEVVDVVVAPAHQRQGIGRRIMEHIMAFLERAAPQGAYISLIADVPELYEKFGFVKCSPRSEGMYIRT